MFNGQCSIPKRLLIAGFLFLAAGTSAQTVNQRLQKAYLQFEKDSQLQHAVSSLYVIDANNGEVIFDKNGRTGLVPASTQKVITSVTAFELLGRDFRYATVFGLLEHSNKSQFYIKPSGDPTLGSWRWATTGESVIARNLAQELARSGKLVNDGVVINQAGWSSQQIPDGWIWQDIANYYGAGAGALNWRENQFNLVLSSGPVIGEKVEIVSTEPKLYNHELFSEVTAAREGSGDRAYIYFPVSGNQGTVRGTIPIKENAFTISGAMPDPPMQLVGKLRAYLPEWKSVDPTLIRLDREPADSATVFYTHYSPRLDSIIYWFNKNSINLYGEALIKTMAYHSTGFGSTDSGVALLRRFWKEKGLDEQELNLYDGSGLSPLNRITTHAQAEILKYARTRDWFPAFLSALPVYNGMTMKSGTISDVKGFCGYHRSKSGREYIFSFLVNNYSGRSSGVVGKMYRVLDELK